MIEDITTWEKEIELCKECENDKNDKIIFCTLTDEELKTEFDKNYGSENGKPFLAYSERFVYFPICYDGAEWVGRLPRNPDENFNPIHFGNC